MSTDTADTAYSRDVVVASRVGLHARPARLIAEAAAAQTTVVRIGKGERVVEARSLLSLLTLGAEHGDRVTLSAEGPDAEVAVTELAELVETDLDADE